MFICYLTNALFVMFIAGTTDATGAAATGQGAPIGGGVRFGLSQAANLDNSWTFEGHENEHDPQVDTRAPLASRRSFDAERTGFEPATKTRGQQGDRFKAAQNAAHLARGKPRMIPSWQPSSRPGTHFPMP